MAKKPRKPVPEPLPSGIRVRDENGMGGNIMRIESRTASGSYTYRVRWDDGRATIIRDPAEGSAISEGV